MVRKMGGLRQLCQLIGDVIAQSVVCDNAELNHRHTELYAATQRHSLKLFNQIALAHELLTHRCVLGEYRSTIFVWHLVP